MRHVLFGVLIAWAATADAVTPAETCQARKNKTAGQYSSCRQDAEGKRALTGDGTAYDLAIGKCVRRYTGKWPQIEGKANGACPSNDDQTAVQGFVDTHSSDLAAALAGGPLPDCPGDFATCQADLGTCDDDLATCNAGLLSSVLKTGETTCTDAAGTTIPCAGTGQDGELQMGLSRSYVDNGDGTITDTRTGLMWEKLSDDGSVHDKDDRYTWTSAFSKVAALNAGGGFAGHTDWRLPNVNELHGILNYGARHPAVSPEFDTGCAPACTVTTCSCVEDGYNTWSSTSYHVVTNNAWMVNFFDGGLMGFDKSADAHVRAVRGGS